MTGCDSRGFHFPVESIVELQGVGGTKLVRELAEDISRLYTYLIININTCVSESNANLVLYVNWTDF